MRDAMQPAHVSSSSEVLSIEGVAYFTAAQAARIAGVSRQTLWRWRQDGKVPTGRRYRDKQILFTSTEVERIRDYANRLEPLEPTKLPQSTGQLRLFQHNKGRPR